MSETGDWAMLLAKELLAEAVPPFRHTTIAIAAALRKERENTVERAYVAALGATPAAGLPSSVKPSEEGLVKRLEVRAEQHDLGARLAAGNFAACMARNDGRAARNYEGEKARETGDAELLRLAAARLSVRPDVPGHGGGGRGPDWLEYNLTALRSATNDSLARGKPDDAACLVARGWMFALRDTLDDAIAALPKWLPIETAPKDGTRFFAIDVNAQEAEPMIVWWSEKVIDTPHKWSAMPKFDGLAGFIAQKWCDPNNCVLPDATHWQPLPKAPA